jgi:hypothetical protein
MIISSILAVDQNDLTTESSSADFEQWDSVMQLEILAQIEMALPGVLAFSPELPSMTSLITIWNEVERFQIR